jgi:hypothetical protein
MKLENITLLLFMAYSVASCFSLDKPNDNTDQDIIDENKDPKNKTPTTQKPQSPSKIKPILSETPSIDHFSACSNSVAEAYNLLPQPTIDKNNFEKKYKRIKQFSGGSGDQIFKVADESGVEKILKIFPHPADQDKRNKFEIIITCRNSQVPFFHLFKDMDEKDSEAFGTFFPKFFEMGTVPQEYEITQTSTDGTSKKIKKTEIVPFMVIESLSGKDLREAVPKLKSMNSKELLSIAYQIALAIDTAFEYYAFKHYDLHPGNIRLLDERINLVTQNGIHLDGPKVVIFDFGLGRDKDFTLRQQKKLFADNETRPDTKVLREFLSKFSFSSSPRSIASVAASKSNNQDVRFFNQIFAALWTVLKKNNFVDHDFPYCGPAMKDCLRMDIFSKLK